jgi:ubiquinone/menaquinone biosynthesis C-methylase UbiE
MGALLVERHDVAKEFPEPVTERLLRGAGIRRGMQVLDLGCGDGDISLLAAKLTGPNGMVLGLDRDAAALETARHRASQEDLDQAYFLNAAVDDLRDEGTFDAVIGRHILDRAGDPVAAVRNAARLLRAGGVMAFEESSPTIMQILEEAGLTSPQLFGGTASGRPHFCVWAHKPA